MTEREIFTAALEKDDPAARAAFLDEACAGDAGLRQRIESLLAEHEKLGSFMNVSSPAQTIDQPLSERPGMQIGPYKLLQQIGEGGMGVVFMAEQHEPVKRRVALKIIKPGMDSAQVIARFEAERQALSLMDHPNIAKVLDAGTTASGRPFFVMELVKGQPITQYCDEKHLTPRQRLELLLPVCQAIQHAHQKGIIHRDIKPTNILVAEYDNQPVPKVIDFGVAKATSQALTEKTMFTGFGQIIGTLEYMSPEQAKVNQLDIDTRSDIYSLGVLLYELLTGSTPFDRQRLRSAAFDEMLRIIREEEPPKPSTRLSRSRLPDGTSASAPSAASGSARQAEPTLASIAAVRGTEPAKLTKLVRGELDWIVMKALEKDRNRRYETAGGFAADVQRYLADEPVQACPPSAGYRLRKFVRRNKRALATGALLGVMLLVALGAVAGSLGWVARDQATRRLVVEGIVTEAMEEADKWQKEERWAEALAAVKRAEAALAGGNDEGLRHRVENRRKDLEMVATLEEARLHTTAATIEAACATNPAGADAEYVKAFREYGLDIEALDTEEAADRVRARAICLQLTAALDDWAMIRRRSRGEDDASWKHFLAVAQAADPDPWRNEVRGTWQRGDREALVKVAARGQARDLSPPTLHLMGRWLRDAGMSNEAAALLREAQRRHPDDFGINFELAYGLVAMRSGKSDEAIRFATAALALRPRSPFVYLILGNAFSEMRRFDEAVAAHREAIRLNPNYAVAHNNLGNGLREQGKLDDAIASFREAIRLRPDSAAAYSNLGNALRDQGKLDEAIACYKKAIELDPNFPHPRNNLGKALGDQGKLDEAIACYKKAIELDPKHAPAYNNLGNALRDQKKPDEAIDCYRKAIELDPKHAPAYNNLGNVLRDQKKPDEAIDCYRKAIELDPKQAFAYNNLGNALSDQTKLDEAIAAFRKAIELDPRFAPLHYNLGHALRRHGKTNEAIESYQKAIEFDPKLALAHSNLGNALRDQKKLDEAIACYQKAIELDPKLALAHSNLGVALSGQKKLDQAIACFKKAIEFEPNSTFDHNTLAWLLGTCPDPRFRDPAQAVKFAKKAVELAPKDGNNWNTLGVAYYRAGDWNAAIAALEKSMELRKGGDSFDWFFLAMAHWQLSDTEEARKWYDQAVEWMDKNQPDNEELLRFRQEAEELMEIKKP